MTDKKLQQTAFSKKLMRYKMVRILLIVCVLMVSGCSMLTGQDTINTTNQLISDSNTARLTAYSDGMAACGNNAACQVGVSMAFATGAGQQPFFKPDTAVDYLRAGLPWAEIFLRGYMIWGGGAGGTSGDRAVNYVKGDGNILLIGNKTTATDKSTATIGFQSAYTRSWDGYNRDYSLAGNGNVSDGASK